MDVPSAADVEPVTTSKDAEEEAKTAPEADPANAPVVAEAETEEAAEESEKKSA